jgi:hypothetical protein
MKKNEICLPPSLMKSLSSRQADKCILEAGELKNVDEKSLSDFHNLLTGNPLKEFCTEEWPFDDKLTASLLTILSSMKTLEVIKITGPSIGNISAAIMGSILARNANISQISFGGFQISDQGLQLLSLEIKKHKTLKKCLLVAGNQISEQGLFKSAMSIAENTSLVEYDQINGFLLLPSIRKFTNFNFYHLFLKQIIDRNKKIENAESYEEYSQIYNDFANVFNQTVSDPILFTKEYQYSKILNKSSQAYLKISKIPFPTLLEMCIFSLKKSDKIVGQEIIEIFKNNEKPFSPDF